MGGPGLRVWRSADDWIALPSPGLLPSQPPLLLPVDGGLRNWLSSWGEALGLLSLLPVLLACSSPAFHPSLRPAIPCIRASLLLIPGGWRQGLFQVPSLQVESGLFGTATTSLGVLWVQAERQEEVGVLSQPLELRGLGKLAHGRGEVKGSFTGS